MKVLVVNAGSSSLKYQLFDTTSYTVLAKGLCDRIGLEHSTLTHTNLVAETPIKKSIEIDMPNHAVATKEVVALLTDKEVGCISDMSEIEAVGHRVVHGGYYFSESMLATPEVMEKLELCRDFAPLHTGAHIQGIHGCTAVMPNVPQVLVFDTAFHQTMPSKAYTYAVESEVAKKYGVRRYGAHGTSHRYVAGEMIKIMGKAEGTKIVTCHLGHGSSISAIKDGKVLDTSMGFTPLAGVIMGSRTGDMDPAVVSYLMDKLSISADKINDYMNKKCGLLGVSGVSSDLREVFAELETNANGKAEDAKLAIEILVYGIKKYIGAYAAAMNGVDAIVFTAGIGENNAAIREMVLSDMDYLGIKIDTEVNNAPETRGNTTKISSEDSKVLAYLIPTNEELVIAKDTETIVANLAK